MCNCIDAANSRLLALAVRLQTSQPISRSLDLLPPRALLRVERISQGRKPLPELTASFCPFCGEKYPKTIETKENDHASA